MPTDEGRAPLAEGQAAGGVALLIIDMLSNWQFPQGHELLRHAAVIAPRIEALKLRCREAGIPVIYINDNHGRWRSDIRGVAWHACTQEGEGAWIAHRLQPLEDDYCVLKPKHSGFYATPLELLLRHLHVAKLILAGVSAEHCVAMTAMDACLRDFKVWCPSDTVASHRTEIRDQTLSQLWESVHACTDASDTLRLPDLN